MQKIWTGQKRRRGEEKKVSKSHKNTSRTARQYRRKTIKTGISGPCYTTASYDQKPVTNQPTSTLNMDL